MTITIDASAASGQSAQLQCLELITTLYDKNGRLRQHEDCFLRLGEQVDNLNSLGLVFEKMNE